MIAGAILAGGASSRMGADKSLAPLGGRPLIRWVFDALQPLGRVIVVANDGKERGIPPGPAVHYVRDRYPGAGPLAGVHAAIAALKAGEACVVAATCDMPFVFSELARALAERVASGKPPHACVWADESGRRQHFPAAFHRLALPAVEEALASDDRSLRGLLNRLHADVVDIGEVAPRGSLRAVSASFNVNTPDDLKEAEAMAARLS